MSQDLVIFVIESIRLRPELLKGFWKDRKALDTVITGSQRYDFDNALCSTINSATGDKRDLSIAHANLAIYEKYTQGSLATTYNILEPRSWSSEYLTFSTHLMNP